MENFCSMLKKAKLATENLKSHENIHLVLGNESCDLDSTISALSLSYLIHLKYSQAQSFVVIPILNVEASHFRFRTEICHLLKKYKIDSNILVFRNEINYADLLKTKNIKTSLVDHHVLSQNDRILEKTVVQIFDHRILNSEEMCKSDILEKCIMKIVGSCTTLIAGEIIENNIPLFNELANLIYATIIYDTIGLNPENGRTFPEDITIATRLENLLEITPNFRKTLFEELWKVHNDTSSLTSKELLYRDLKIVKGVPIPGLPMTVENYLQNQDADEALVAFAAENSSVTVVLLGINAGKGEVKRDIGVFGTSTETGAKIISSLKSDKDLDIVEVAVRNPNIICLKQGNIKLTRKYILPLVNAVIVQ